MKLALAECDQAAEMYRSGLTLRQISTALHHGDEITRLLVKAGGGEIRLPRMRSYGPRCDKCGILLTESGDELHDNDPPDARRCWACREVYGEP